MRGKSSSNNNANQKFGCYTVTQRLAAAEAAKRIRESAEPPEDELELEGDWQSPSSESDETWSHKPVSQQLSNGSNRPSWLGRISSISSIRGLGDSLFVEKKSDTSSNNDMDDNCSQTSKTTGITPTKRSRGRPANVKMEKESTTTAKDGNTIVTPIPEHIKNAIQLMLSVRHGFKGLQWELVESEFHHVYPNLASFKPSNHGYKSFEELLKSPEMKTRCYAATPRGTVKGHDLHSRQGRLKYDPEAGVLTIVMRRNDPQEQEEDSKTNVETKIQQINQQKTPAIPNEKQNSPNNTSSQQVTETRPSSRNSLPQKNSLGDSMSNVGKPKTKVCKPSETKTLPDNSTMQRTPYPNPKVTHACVNNNASSAANKDAAIVISTPESVSNTSETTIVPTQVTEIQTDAQKKAVEDLLKIPALQNIVNNIVSQICQTNNNSSQPVNEPTSSTTTNPEGQFAPNDGFAQFYRREELPDNWTRVKTYENSTEPNASEPYRRNYYHERSFDSYDPREISTNPSRLDSSRRGRPGPERRNSAYSPIIPNPTQRGRGYSRYGYRRKNFLHGSNQDEHYRSPLKHSHHPSPEETFRPQNPREQNLAYSVAVLQQAGAMADHTISEIASSLFGIKYGRSTPSTPNQSEETNGVI
ncbi:hypothetical protein Fcan01_13379 [Folsomia candida]|uniref:Uncharacterized protein n=1 Tax=Folsomia candida TaxID=158441 RepID=A0A226E3P5_FOLCA|nr:hypothetical protein Fcan01_13379 [Folsomia candida]